MNGHAEHGVDRFRVDILAVIQPIIQPDEHVPGARCSVGFAFDLDAIAAGGDVHPQPLLDGDQVPVIIAEQGSEQVWLVELKLKACAVRHGGEVAARH